MITVDLSLNCAGNIGGVGVDRGAETGLDPDSSLVGELGWYGLFFLEVCPYIVSTVCTLVLLFWLLTCLDLFPQRYSTRFRTMKIVLIIYHIVLYGVFLTSALLIVAASRAHVDEENVGPIMRDLVL
jgi:hypothetical protein